MQRYFFHVEDGANYPDLEGMLLPDLNAARVEAVRFAGDLLRDNANSFWQGDQWTMRVTDDANLTLFTLMIVAQDAAAILRR